MPWALSSAALAVTAMVGDGLMADMRSAIMDTGVLQKSGMEKAEEGAEATAMSLQAQQRLDGLGPKSSFFPAGGDRQISLC